MASRDTAGPVSGMALIVSFFAVLVAAVSVVVVSVDDGGGGGDGEVATAGPAVEVTLADFSISPDPIVVGVGGSLAVMNEGNTAHNLALTDGDVTTADLQPGQSEDLSLSSLESGEYEVRCTIPGHAEAGMVADLNVTAEATQAPVASGEGGTAAEEDWAELDRTMEESIMKFPAETEGIGNQELEPVSVDGNRKVFELTAEIVDWEVEPGKIVQAWAYNGQVPGPYIKVDVGDEVQIVLENKLPMGTDMHMHGIDMPNGMDGVAPITQELIMPGESFTYEFTALRQAVGTYHAHHHGEVQIPNGLFGTIQVGDVELPLGETVSGVTIPEDLEVSQEFPMVLNDAGVIGLSLNGKGFPATTPYVTNLDDWVLVHYENEGMMAHPMHAHGFRQLVVAKDGVSLDQPYWVDTINVAPGERYSVLIQTDVAGTWVWHCHILNHAERATGMFGMVTAFVVQDPAAEAAAAEEEGA